MYFIVVQDWMLKDLGLKPSDALLFALIYGFCQDGSTYKINKTYIAKVLNMTRMSIFSKLRVFVEKKLLIVESYKYGGETKYKCSLNLAGLPANVSDPIRKILIKEKTEDNGGFQEI